ncbi:MAG: SOUL family heme-binding protein [Planctomycetota bacterium]
MSQLTVGQKTGDFSLIMRASSYIMILILPVFLCSCATVGIEKAKYEVVDKQGKFEIRQYRPQIVAETVVESDFDNAGNAAFRRLFNYISGENRKKESIAMTAPVNQKGGSQKIAMTAPVNQQQSEGNYSVTFLMPSKYTMETLPEPLDPAVKLREIAARKIAAIRYSGSWSRKKYETNKALLEEFIAMKGLRITGQDIFARYDPPFQLWFLRRNEVLFPVE